MMDFHNKGKTDFKLRRDLLIPNLGLATSEGIIFFIFLLVLPKDPKNEIFLGFSPQRLFLLSGVIAITLIFFASSVYFRRHLIIAIRIDTWLLGQENRIPFLLVGYILLWAAIFGGLALHKPVILQFLKNSSYVIRLIPFWGWALLIPLQLVCFWFYEWKWSHVTFASYLTLAFFICTLALGFNIYQDYGLAWDEPLQVDIGRANWSYLHDRDPKLLTFKDRYYGPAYEVLLLRLTDTWDTSQMFLKRHLVNFLFFFLGVVAFWGLTRKLFSSDWMALIASLCLVLSPRIFADSFYNTKDIPFMVVFIFAMNTMISFVKKPSWWNVILHAVVSAFLVAIRVIGILIPMFTWAFLSVRWILQPKPEKVVPREILNGFIYSILVLGLTILLWPALWHNPMVEFYTALNEMSHYPYNNNVLYLGASLKPDQIPWHYIPVWISISTPLLYLACFGLGVSIMLTNFIRQPVKWLEGSKHDNLIILTCFFGPLLAVILLRSTLYNAWRQMFFIYPSFLLIAVQGMRSAICFLQRRLRPFLLYPVLAILLAVGLFDPASFMVRNHPFEHVYFNRLAGENMSQIKQRFELDYWGLAFQQGIEYILKSDPEDKIPIFITMPGIYYIVYRLPDDLERRLVVKESPNQARYFVGSYVFHPQEYPYTKKIYSVDVDGASLLSVFDLRVEPDNQSK